MLFYILKIFKRPDIPLSMEKFRYLDHTADVKFQAFGRDIEEAFANAALATTNVITDVNKVRTKIKKEITIKAKTKEALLFDFLDELIFLLDTEHFIAAKAKVEIEKGYILKAKLEGDDVAGYKTTGDIKAATYNFMFIKEEEGKTTVQVVLDL